MLNGSETDKEALAIVKKNLNSECTVLKIFGMSDLKQIRRTLLPKSLYDYNYVILDTSNVSPELSTKYSFGWRVISNGSYETGSVSCVNTMRDIVGMRIFPVSMVLATPVVDSVNVNKTYINNVANLNSNFTILIHEMQAQSYIGRDGRKFHFSLFPALMNPSYPGGNSTPSFSIPGPSITPTTPYYEMTTSGKNNGWFWFKKPITELNTITISIGNPFDLLSSDNNTRILIPIQFIYLNDNKYIDHVNKYKSDIDRAY